MSHKFITASSTLAIALRLLRFFCALFDRTHKSGADEQIFICWRGEKEREKGGETPPQVG